MPTTANNPNVQMVLNNTTSMVKMVFFTLRSKKSRMRIMTVKTMGTIRFISAGPNTAMVPSTMGRPATYTFSGPSYDSANANIS